MMPKLDINVADEELIARDAGPVLPVLFSWRDNITRWADALLQELGDSRGIMTGDGTTLDRRLTNIVNDVADIDIGTCYPLVPVSFIGDYTDGFENTDGLTGPTTDGVGSESINAIDGELVFTGTDTGNGRAWCGREGGYFLSGDKSWSVVIKVTECGTLYEGAGLQVFGPVGRKCRLYFYYQTATPLLRIYAEDATISTKDVGSLPTRAAPLYLKVTHSYSGTTHTIKYEYKYEGGSYSTIATHTPAEATMTWADYLLDTGPMLAVAGGTAGTVRFEEITVSYADGASARELGYYAFIPTQNVKSYRKNHIYRLYPDGKTYEDIEPQTGMIVRAVNQLYQYDGSDWVVFQLSHAHLANINEDDHHPRLHDMDSDSDHTPLGGTPNTIVLLDADGDHPVQDSGVTLPLDLGANTEVELSGATEDNLAAFNANAALKDSGTSLTDISSEIDSDVADLLAKITAWLAGLNLASIPGPYVPPRFEQAARPTVAQMAGNTLAVWKDTDDNKEYLCWSNGSSVFAVEGT